MKCVYVADDGKKFELKSECIKYEEEIRQKELEKKKKEDERERRYKEVHDAYEKYLVLADKYCEDYMEEADNNVDLWDSLRKIMYR